MTLRHRNIESAGRRTKGQLVNPDVLVHTGRYLPRHVRQRPLSRMLKSPAPIFPRHRSLNLANGDQQIVGVVDDDEGVVASCRFLLEVAGYFVETFGSAVEFLQSETGHLACLILDYHMPHMSGLELAEKIRGNGSNVPILLMTASPSPGILVRATELRIDRVLEKPFDEGELLGFVNLHQS
jgi:CheY-like chemotaxis protein